MTDGLLHTWAGHIECDPTDCTVAHLARLAPRDREARICRRYFTGTDVLCKNHGRDLRSCEGDRLAVGAELTAAILRTQTAGLRRRAGYHGDGECEAPLTDGRWCTRYRGHDGAHL